MSDCLDFGSIILKNRSYRRFVQSEAITAATLCELVEHAAKTPSGRNLQPLRFVTANTTDTNAKIFGHLKWAGYLTDWEGPEEGERPAAYVVVCVDTELIPANAAGQDIGISSQTLLLHAVSKGYGGCMIGAFDRKGVAAELEIPERYEPVLVLALGKPAETVVLEDMEADGDFKYYRDESSVHHVPKRKLEDILLKSFV